ncbi:zinc ribbon domain-containing protein [Candidatus Accumulibacter sp. ACC003]|uniref:FmdB family zinc ribbon protein n=1 Tax=Candidatus Accumulibacter sp. ACC003 TaxID=2823334 RepID=UPI0025C4478A|nr:zinc ribbon domain-containing protein [Candidatus Accumulibacter sp. ACC003]
MPIYAYRCASCAFAKDHLQKLSDPTLSVCPQCGQATYRKQVTAAGFQLKGTGWYVTDFKGGNKAPTTAVGKPENSESSEKAPAAASSTADTATTATAAAPKADTASSTTASAGSSTAKTGVGTDKG